MKRLLAALAVSAFALTLFGGVAAAAEGGAAVSPVARLPFPERGFVVDLPQDIDVRDGVTVTENGRPVRRLEVTPLSASGLRAGIVLALDASESMAGKPLEAALAAAREFVARRQPGQLIGLVLFDGDVRVLEAPTEDEGALQAALAVPPELSYGTRIHDGVDRSLDLLRQSRLSTGSIVVLSDGADLGSRKSLEAVVADAARQHVRVFTVGLRSGAFKADALRAMADGTGGRHAEARTSADLAGIYRTLGRRFAREYLIQYRSDAPAESRVDVRIAIGGMGTLHADYLAPTPSRIEPYQRSLLTRFLLSSASIFALALLGAALVAWAVMKIVQPQHTKLVERISEFSSPVIAFAQEPELDPVGWGERARYTRGWWARLDRDLEIARIAMPARTVVAWTLTATALAVFVLAIVSPIVALLGLLTPVISRTLIKRKLRKLREEFADQLPTNLQVLASALRAGHSFNGALDVVLENAQEPARSELGRIVREDRFGIPPEESIRTVAERMANRDLEQVALLAELQRTSGGNSAEVLDTVVDTIRERAEIRRLVRTLTAQGRMARWILTALPIVLAGFQAVMNPELMSVLFETRGGQIMLVVASLMVFAGSIFIQRIVDIDV